MWGIVMEPGKKYSTVVEKTFHLSMATLDLESVKKADDVHTVYVETDDNPRVILCHLSKASKLYQCRLDHIFPRGTYLKFVTSATANIHMTGYLGLNEDDELYSDLESESDEEGTEIEKPVQEKSNKRKSEDNVSKKNKSIKLDESNRSDEDTDDENDFDEIMDFEDDSEDDGIKLTIMVVEDPLVEELNVRGESPEREEETMAVDDPPRATMNNPPETTVNVPASPETNEESEAVNHSSLDTDIYSSDEDEVENKSDDKGSVQSTGNSDIDSLYKYHCADCHLSFKYNCWFKRHMAIHKPGTFACQYCPKVFKRKDSMREHEYLHVGGPKHKCKLCSKEFSDKRNMNMHVKLVHNGSMVKCEKCGKMYSGKRQLRYHDNRVHSLITPYKCNTCGEAFPVPCLLAAHRLKKGHKEKC